jgi:hypothetical protein
MNRKALLLVLMILLLGGRALAMSSDSYRLDWFSPLTTGAGGSVSSPSYTVSYVLGQSASGILSSPANRACLGYFCLSDRGGTRLDNSIFLPLSVK